MRSIIHTIVVAAAILKIIDGQIGLKDPDRVHNDPPDSASGFNHHSGSPDPFSDPTGPPDSPFGPDDPGSRLHRSSFFSKPSSDPSNPSSTVPDEPASFEFQKPRGSLNLPTIYDSMHRPENPRTLRSADTNAKELIRQISVIARIANGIALQAGLLNGTIPIDAAVGELLNFGTVRTSDIINFDSKAVTALIVKIRSMKSVLKLKRTSSDQLKDMIATWNSIRKASLSIKGIDLSNVYKKLKEVDLKLNYEVVEMFDLPSRLANRLGEIRSLKLDPNDQSTALSAYTQIVQDINAMKKGLKLAGELRGKFVPFSEIAVDMETFQSAQTFFEVLDMRRKNSPEFGTTTDRDEAVQEVKEHIATISKMSDTLKAAQPQVSNLLNVFQSRQLPFHINRAFTSGFSQGVVQVEQLSKEVREPWLERIATNDGSTRKLADSLQPIFSASGKIVELDSKLKGFSYPETVASLKTITRIVDTTLKIMPKVENPAEILSKYIGCNSEGQTLTSNDAYISAMGFAGDIKHFFDHYNKFLDSDLLNENFGWFIKKIDDLMTLMGFTSKADVTWEKLEEIHEKVSTSQEAELLEASAVKMMAKTAGVKRFRITNVKDLIALQKTVTGFLESDLALSETKVHKCLKELGNKPDEASDAFDILETLREFGSDADKIKILDSVETLAASVALFSKDLASIGSLRETIKKQSTNNTEDLIKMPDSMSISKAIGQTAQQLQDIFTLNGLRQSVPDLENIKEVVDVEINDISDLMKRRRVVENWGSYAQDMRNLKVAIQSLEPFIKGMDKLKVTRLEDYGKLIENLKPGPDVKFEAAKKSEALGDMIDIKDSDKRNLQMIKCKKTFDELSTLDLQFSKYSSSMKSAPSAFKALDDFLTQFLRIESNDEKSEGSSSDASNLILIIVCSVLGGILLIAGIVVFVMWKMGWACFKPKEEPLPPDVIYKDNREVMTNQQLHFYMTGYRFRKPLDSYNFHSSLLRTILAEQLRPNFMLYKAIDPRKCRDPTIRLVQQFAIRSVEYHGNRITCRTGLTFFALQGPLSASDTHDDTVNDFLELLAIEDLRQCVMLCRFEEAGPDGVMREVCARYFADGLHSRLTCGNGLWEVHTMLQEPLEGMAKTKREGDVTHRRLHITHKQKKYEPFYVEHYQYNNWDDNSFPPNGHQACYKIMMLSRNTSGKGIAVHCSTGTGRTMAFIGCEYIAQMVDVDSSLSFAMAATKFAATRYNAIHSIRQSFWLQLGVIFYLGQFHGMPTLYGMHFAEFQELAVRYANHPEIPKDHQGLIF